MAITFNSNSKFLLTSLLLFFKLLHWLLVHDRIKFNLLLISYRDLTFFPVSFIVNYLKLRNVSILIAIFIDFNLWSITFFQADPKIWNSLSHNYKILLFMHVHICATIQHFIFTHISLFFQQISLQMHCVKAS